MLCLTRASKLCQKREQRAIDCIGCFLLHPVTLPSTSVAPRKSEQRRPLSRESARMPNTAWFRRLTVHAENLHPIAVACYGDFGSAGTQYHEQF